jgi:putative ABC transport system permease protein
MRNPAEIIFPLGIPFSWLQLTSSKTRFLTAAAGVMFAAVLMLLQLGFYDGILDQVVHPVKAMNGELIMVSKQFEQVTACGVFSKRRAMRAKTLDDVEAVRSVYTAMGTIKSVGTNACKEIFVFAFDPADRVFDDDGGDAGRALLKNEENVLFDKLSEDVYGPVLDTLEKNGEVPTEIEGVKLVIKGLVSMGSTLAAKGHIVMSDLTFLRVFKNRPPNMINFAVVKLKPGRDTEEAAKKLQEMFQDDIKVFTKDALVKKEQVYWRDRTPIGFVVTAGMVVAMVVGSLIVYQILFNDVTSHLPEYATLKAVGLRDIFFFKTIVEESLILMVCGIIPGILLSVLLYHFARIVTNMPIYMTWEKAALVSGLIFLTCLFSGLFASRELRSANPAEIF